MYNNSTYLLVVDYASSYVDIAMLTETTSTDVILHLKPIFARYVIPETVVSDNGPQYMSLLGLPVKKASYTSSTRYPQINGKVERTVQTVKAMLKKSVDPYGALLTYRTTSLECGYSPAQLLMGRQLSTSIPMLASAENINTQQIVGYDRYHRAQPLSTLCAGDPV